MLIWLNGAFGAGKTTVARRILSLRPTATIVDPEQIGFLLRRMLPVPKTQDFQDLPLWREMTLRILTEAATGGNAPLIVPMTLVNTGYFSEIIGGLGAAGVDVRHFTLVAPVATLRRRLYRRLGWPRSRRWALARAEPAAAALAGPLFAEHIDTTHLGVGAVADHILARTGA